MRHYSVYDLTIVEIAAFPFEFVLIRAIRASSSFLTHQPGATVADHFQLGEYQRMCSVTHCMAISKTRQMPITCEQCHTGQIFEMQVRVDVASDPQDKENLLAGKLHTFTCRQCNASKMYDFPLLYEDKKKHLMILVATSQAEVIHLSPPPGVGKTTQLRIVSTRNELIEKILIRDDKLDDRVVEFMKLQVRLASLQRSMPVDGYLMFSGVVKNDDDEDAVQFQDVTGSDDDTFMSTPLPYYRAFAKMLKPFIERMPKPETLWQRVDQEYGKQLERLVDQEATTPSAKGRRRGRAS